VGWRDGRGKGWARAHNWRGIRGGISVELCFGEQFVMDGYLTSKKFLKHTMERFELNSGDFPGLYRDSLFSLTLSLVKIQLWNFIVSN
jgi:hypothetical protein